MLASSGYVCRVDTGDCVACGACIDACQFGAISLNGGAAVVDEDACMGCGVCISTCAPDALSLLRDVSRGEPLNIRALVADRG
jgi:ferredoxin